MTELPELPDQPFTAAQARSLEITRRRLRTALNDGELRRVLYGVYVRSDLDDDVELRCRALALVLHDGNVIRDRTAAWLHGIDLFGWNEKELLPRVEASALRGQSVSRRGDCDGGSRDLAPVDVITLHGLRVTTPLRTALDLGCCLSGRDGLAALDAFMRGHALTRTDLRLQLGRYRRRRGVVQLRRIVAWADPLAESPAESWVRYEILSAALPPPVSQHWVTIRGVPTYRLDLAYPHLKIVIEYDGEEFHGPEQREYDEARRDWLRAHGWFVLVLDRDSFSAQAVDGWLRELGREIRERSVRRRFR